MERLSALNIGPYQQFNLADYDDEIQRAIIEGVKEAQQAIEARGNDLGVLIDGWLEIPPMGNYGTDYLFR